MNKNELLKKKEVLIQQINSLNITLWKIEGALELLNIQESELIEKKNNKGVKTGNKKDI